MPAPDGSNNLLSSGALAVHGNGMEGVQSLLQLVPFGIVFQDAEGNILTANPAAESVLGLSYEQMVGRKSLDPRWKALHEDGSPFPGEDHPAMTALRTGLPGEAVMGVFNPSKEQTTWITVSAVPLFCPGEEAPSQVMTTFLDITERRRIEEELRESQDLFRAIFDSNTIGIVVSAVTGPTDGSVLTSNRAFQELVGYSNEELACRSFKEYTHPDDIEAEEALIEGLTTQTRAFYQIEKRFVRKGGQVVWGRLHGIALRDRGGRVTGGVCVIEDITGRKQAEEALEMSRRTLFEAQRLAQVGSWQWDLQTNKVQWSPEIYRITGLDPENYDGSPDLFLDIVHHEDKEAFTQVMNKTRSQGGTTPLEYRVVRPDGSVRTVFATGTLVLDAEGRTTQCIGTIQDITERRLAEEVNLRLQQQLQQAQKMESLGNLSGGIAHDMNNVLGAILGIASANLQIQPKGSPAHNSFETIVKAATRGGEMVRGLLSFARQSQAEERTLDLNAILKEDADLLARTTLARVELRLDLEADLLPIRGDSGALSHAFMNLCVNAVDAMPENGTLSIRTRNIGREWAEVVIEDTGLGMSKEVLEKAMDPFFTTKGVGKGTGLGLTMVYKTVKAHRGLIELQSQPGRGTQVAMRFPVSEPVVTDHEVASGAWAAVPAQTLRILLVDDDELIRSSTGMVVQTLGHSVTTSSSGEEALALVEAGLRPEAVILDMNMPGMGGAGTLPRLRELLPGVPVLLSSGRTDQAALDLSKVHPSVLLLPKPFSITELKACLESLAEGGGCL